MELTIRGQQLSIEYTDGLIEQIRKRFNLSSDAIIPDELIVSFLKSELSDAIKRAEDGPQDQEE
jgi:hypothetical protein